MVVAHALNMVLVWVRIPPSDLTSLRFASEDRVNMFLNIKKLKALIADLPDDMQVILPGSDHSYNRCRGSVSNVAWDEGYGGFFEYAGDHNLSPTEIKAMALVISDE